MTADHDLPEPNAPQTSFAHKLWRVMVYRERTRAQVSKAVGCHWATVQQWLYKGTEPSNKRARAVAGYLGVDLDWLINKSDRWPPPNLATGGGILDAQERIERILSAIPEADRRRVIARLRIDP